MEATTAVLLDLRELLFLDRLATKRTGSASYLSQKLTVAVNAFCDSLWRARRSPGSGRPRRTVMHSHEQSWALSAGRVSLEATEAKMSVWTLPSKIQ